MSKLSHYLASIVIVVVSVEEKTAARHNRLPFPGSGWWSKQAGGRGEEERLLSNHKFKVIFNSPLQLAPPASSLEIQPSGEISFKPTYGSNESWYSKGEKFLQTYSEQF